MSEEISSPILKKKATRKAVIKKLPKEEKIVIKFDYDKYNEDDLTKCMEKHTPFEFKTMSRKEGEGHFTMKVEKSNDPEDNVYYTKESIIGTIDATIEKYREMRLKKERTRKCRIKELDGRFYMHVGPPQSNWSYDSDESDGEDFEIFL